MTISEYAFIKDSKVVNIAVFNDPTEELLDIFKKEHELDLIILSDGYCRLGDMYDGNEFFPPKPFSSWIKNTELRKWDPPIPKPIDGKFYSWDELTGSWNEVA